MSPRDDDRARREQDPAWWEQDPAEWEHHAAEDHLVLGEQDAIPHEDDLRLAEEIAVPYEERLTRTEADAAPFEDGLRPAQEDQATPEEGPRPREEHAVLYDDPLPQNEDTLRRGNRTAWRWDAYRDDHLSVWEEHVALWEEEIAETRREAAAREGRVPSAAARPVPRQAGACLRSMGCAGCPGAEAAAGGHLSSSPPTCWCSRRRDEQ
ncbi:hypothetical protein [Sphaerisporangium dianthi]|uniref:Uncharacterized protein n=1 Tax=Sphaerisporangium dianthi TaxID=1436120 RepID=A0ABV9CUS6_9ACTN